MVPLVGWSVGLGRTVRSHRSPCTWSPGKLNIGGGGFFSSSREKVRWNVFKFWYCLNGGDITVLATHMPPFVVAWLLHKEQGRLCLFKDNNTSEEWGPAELHLLTIWNRMPRLLHNSRTLRDFPDQKSSLFKRSTAALTTFRHQCPSQIQNVHFSTLFCDFVGHFLGHSMSKVPFRIQILHLERTHLNPKLKIWSEGFYFSRRGTVTRDVRPAPHRENWQNLRGRAGQGKVDLNPLKIWINNAKSILSMSKRAIGACPGQFRSQKAHVDHPKKTYFSKKWTKNCHRRSNGSTYPLTNLVFENSMFEKYLSVKQKLQYKDCFLFIAWFDPVLTGWEIPILIHSGG